jgi:hypothetical protein
LGIARNGEGRLSTRKKRYTRADGKVQYDGKMFVKRKGIRRGTVPPAKFAELARFVLDHGFMGLKARYASDVTDQPSVVAIVVAKGKSKTVVDYAHAGPKELAEIESRIDSLFEQVQWDDEPERGQTPPRPGRSEPEKGRCAASWTTSEVVSGLRIKGQKPLH